MSGHEVNGFWRDHFGRNHDITLILGSLTERLRHVMPGARDWAQAFADVEAAFDPWGADHDAYRPLLALVTQIDLAFLDLRITGARHPKLCNQRQL